MKYQWWALPTIAAAMAFAAPAMAQKNYGPGVTDTEIKIGQTMPYSGPASAYGTIGKAEMAYFAMINEQGGVNGRKINLVSLDDAYSPAKTVEQTRKLIEQEGVLLDFNPLGTAPNTAIQKYMNDHKVPQLFIATGATKWGDPEHFPWTMGFQPTYQTEGHIFAKYLLQEHPTAKVAILYQNDDYGKDYVKGFKDGLGNQASKVIVAEATYETSDPVIDSQVIQLQASGADTFYNVTTPKFAAQAIRKVYDIGWKPLHLLNGVSSSIATVLTPAGIEKSMGVISVAYIKDPTDPAWKDEKGYKDWVEWMKKYYPDGDLSDYNNAYGYSVGQALVQVFKQCGNDLTRENIMKQAANLNMELPMLLPGIKVSTGPKQFYPIREMQLVKFNGKLWERFGKLIASE